MEERITAIDHAVKEASGANALFVDGRAPSSFRPNLYEYTSHLRAQSEWARAYHHQREHGRSHHAAVFALLYKWIRIVFRCWKNDNP